MGNVLQCLQTASEKIPEMKEIEDSAFPRRQFSQNPHRAPCIWKSEPCHNIGLLLAQQ